MLYILLLKSSAFLLPTLSFSENKGAAKVMDDLILALSAIISDGGKVLLVE